MPRARARILWLVVVLAVSVFWITAAVSDFFLDRPFVYMSDTEWSDNLVKSLARFPIHAETALQLVAAVLLIPALVCLIGLGAVSGGDPLELAWAKRGASGSRVALMLAALGALVAAVVAFIVLRQVPLIDDERAYAFQSSLFRHGNLSLPPAPAAFRNPMFLLSPWMGKYPPGQSLLLLPGALLGLPHAVTPLLGGALVYSTYGFVREAFGERQALLAAALLAASPALWCASGTIMAFTGFASAMMTSIWLFARARRRGSRRDFALSGAALGMAALVRPFDAVTMGLPLGVWLLADAVRGRPERPTRTDAAILALGAMPFALVFLGYNFLTLGSPFALGYVQASDFSIGFYTQVLPSHAYVHTPFQGLALLPVALIRLDTWLLGWPAALVLVMAGALLARSTWDRFVLSTVLVFGATHMLLASVGTWDVGPTYCFPVVPLLVVLAVRGLKGLRALVPEGSFVRAALGWVPVAGACLAFCTVVPIRCLRLATLAVEIEAPWKAVADARLGEAIVVLPSAFDLAQAAYALGYPYAIESGPGKAHLVRPHSPGELEEARRALGVALPVYALSLDSSLFQSLGVRRYALRRLA